MLPARKAHYPMPRDVDEVLRSIEAEQEREKEALRRFYARNAAPHYSTPLRDWWRKLPLYKRCGYIGCAVMTIGFAFCLALAHLIDWLWP